MDLIKRIIEKIFPSLPEKERAGITLDMSTCWEVSKVKQKRCTAFFKALGKLVPTGATLCIEGTSISKEVKSFLEAHRVKETCKVQLGTLWPRPSIYHVFCNDETLFELANLSERHAVPEICDHLNVYKDGEVLLSWYDAFSDPIYISKKLPEDDLKAFCNTLGCSCKDGSIPDYPG
jgi:hypothetical protein